MNKIIVVTGPTAVGKTKLSIELAKKYDGEIINADSTQIFKELDIATAKVTPDEMNGIKHNLIDIKEITDNYTVYNYQIDCRNCIKDILKRKKTPIIVGGTGLYIKAALYNYDFSVEEKKENNYSSLSNEELYKKLLDIDSNTQININNRQRVIRALEHFDATGKLINKNSSVLLYDTIFIGLTTDRNTLYERINNRVDKMIDNGLIDEAKKIYDTNVRTKAVLTPIGYKELFPYFDHTDNLNNCIEVIKQRSRRYAKRQYTWFNNQMNISWFNVDFNNFENTVNEVEKYIDNFLNNND